jgi:hypothetical protein
MKRRLVILVGVSALVLGPGAGQALADPVFTGPVCDSPSDYAQNHIVPTAQHAGGIGNSGHNPGKAHHGKAGLC